MSLQRVGSLGFYLVERSDTNASAATAPFTKFDLQRYLTALFLYAENIMTIEFSTTVLLILFSAYLLGSVSSAVLICHLLGLNDPRTFGSNNPGATNVWRTGSLQAGIITLIADLLKGILPVWAALLLSLELSIAALCGLCAMLGHLYPLYFQFKGGKGVATFLGVCLALQPLLALCQIGIWLLVAGLSRLSSLASLTTAAATPLLCWWLAPVYLPLSVLPILSLMAALLILRHQSNIIKLLQNQESRF